MATKTKAAPKPRKPAARTKGSVKIEGFTIHEGDRDIQIADGRRFGSIVCGAHNAEPVREAAETATQTIGGRKHAKRETSNGFHVGCDDCHEAAVTTIDSIRRAGGV